MLVLELKKLTKFDATSHKTIYCYLKSSFINHKNVLKLRLNLVTVNILVAHEYKEYIYKSACMHMHAYQYTVNDKSYAVETFCLLVDFIIV